MGSYAAHLENQLAEARRIANERAAEASSQKATISSQSERIAELEAALREKDKALKPFAAIADDYADQEDDDFQVWRDFDVLGASLPLRHFRRARAALAPLGEV